MGLVERAAAPVAVVPLGDVAPVEVRLMERILEEDFAAPAVVLPRVPFPGESFCAERGQYDADVLLESLFLQQPERCLRVVGVADADLFIRGRTFVFGYAHLTDARIVCRAASIAEQRRHAIALVTDRTLTPRPGMTELRTSHGVTVWQVDPGRATTGCAA